MERAIEIIFIAALVIGVLTGAGRNESLEYSRDAFSTSNNTISYEDIDVDTGYNFYNSDYKKYARYNDPYMGVQFYRDDIRRYGPEYLR